MTDPVTHITAHPTRPFLMVEAEQRSPEWFAARLGRVTGSKAQAVFGKTKKGERTAEYDKYMDQLVAEILTANGAEDIYFTADMQRGVDLEPVARDAAATALGMQIRETGFLAHKTLRAGSSLDGDIEDFRAVVEIKCPRTTTHLGYIESKSLPDTYAGQLLHNLYVTQAETIFFVSYDDRLPLHLQLLIVERHAKDLPMAEYEDELLTFISKLELRLDELRTTELQQKY